MARKRQASPDTPCWPAWKRRLFDHEATGLRHVGFIRDERDETSLRRVQGPLVACISRVTGTATSRLVIRSTSDDVPPVTLRVDEWIARLLMNNWSNAQLAAGAGPALLPVITGDIQ